MAPGKKPDPHRTPALKYHFGNHGKVRCVNCQGIPGPLLDTTNIAARRTSAGRNASKWRGAGLTAAMTRNWKAYIAHKRQMLPIDFTKPLPYSSSCYKSRIRIHFGIQDEDRRPDDVACILRGVLDAETEAAFDDRRGHA